jgi:hypothetical protein
MSKPWSKKEMAIVRDGSLSIAEVAAKTGRSPVAVMHQRRRGVFDRGTPPPAVADGADKVKYWRERFDESNRECTRLRSRDNAIRVLVEEVQSIVPTAYSPLPKVSERKTGKGAKGQPQTAHLLLSDSHVGQYVSPNQTLGLGTYSPAHFLRRLKYVEDSVLSICSEHVTTDIDELVVGVLGDMIHGNLQHANEAAHLMPIVDQVVVTSHALAQFLRNVAPKFPRVRVKSVVGNHCVDLETEILTQRGWLKHSEVRVGDMCLGLLPDGVTAVWQPVEHVLVQTRVDSMVKISNREFSFNGTQHHRFYYWVPGHPMLNNAHWSEIEDTVRQNSIRIPANGLVARDGVGVPDSLIELAAAVLTDGSISPGKVTVYQCKDSGWVEAAFAKAGYSPSVYTRTRPMPAMIAGRAVKPGTCTEKSFNLSAADSRDFLARTSLKKGELPPWVWNMTHSQFERFFTTILAGDGTVREGGKSGSVYGKPGLFMDQLQALCVTNGVRATKSNDRENFKLLFCRTPHIAVGAGSAIEKHTTDDRVWCVVTGTENWMCRRDGVAYFTGNSRWGDQKKMPTVNRYSNFDTLVYEMTRALLRDIKNVDWQIDEQPFAYYKVYDYAFLAVHGDHLRGGDKALGIPSHAIGREISFNAQVFPGSHLGQTPNYYVSGHLHRPMELPHANGDVLYNGGFPGVDNYSFNSKLVPSAPSQKLFLIHPKNGRSATWNLSISRGDERYRDVIPYDVPETCLTRLINPGS